MTEVTTTITISSDMILYFGVAVFVAFSIDYWIFRGRLGIADLFMGGYRG